MYNVDEEVNGENTILPCFVEIQRKEDGWTQFAIIINVSTKKSINRYIDRDLRK